MTKESVIVTGGAGFIGSHLVDRLLELGYSVTLVDDFSTGSVFNLETAKLHGSSLNIAHCDITSSDLLAIIQQASPRYIFHLAAQADVRKSLKDPIGDATVNILGSVNVMECARMAGAERLLYAASGGTLYGDPDVALLPLDEEAEHNPLSFYGVSKKGVIDYLKAQKALYGMDYVALALANVYGPRQDPHGESGVVSIFAGKLLAGERCVIYGDGHQTRDFVYVDDVVDAFINAIELGSGETINVASSIETSIDDLYWTVARLAGVTYEAEFLPGRTGEIGRSALSNRKAEKILGWSPKTDLEVGLSQVLSWMGKRP